MATTVAQQIQFMKGWFKQEAIMLFIKNNEEFKDTKTVLVHDKAQSLDATEKEISFYAYNGMSKKVLGTQGKLIVEVNDFERFFAKGAWESLIAEGEKLNMGDYEFSMPQHLLVFDDGFYPMNSLNTIKLTILQYLNRTAFEQKVKNSLTCLLVEIEDENIRNILFDKF